jgi:hypothetical protein
MESVIVVPSVRFESHNPNLSENYGDHLNPQLHDAADTIVSTESTVKTIVVPYRLCYLFEA